MKRNLCIGACFLIAFVIVGVEITKLEKRAAVEAAGVQAPMFEVDPMWPKPLPNHWVLGQAIGVSVDAEDNVWIVNRPNTVDPGEKNAMMGATQCCATAPPVLEYDQAGNLLRHWGGPSPEHDWPASNHGITVDFKGNVWIGGNGRFTPVGAVGEMSLSTPPGVKDGRAAPTVKLPNIPLTPGYAAQVAAAKGYDLGEAIGAEGHEGYLGVLRKQGEDNMILKFNRDGKFLMEIGKPNRSKGSNDTENVRAVAKTVVDKQANEVYAADGYANRRVVVFDADTGKYKRHWGAYGHRPDDNPLGPYNPNDPPAQQFRNPVHCVALSVDRLLYVCDRTNDRIQVFKTDGTFVKEVFVRKETKSAGSTWEVALSKDPKQSYLYVTDGSNNQVHILQRDTLQVLTSFGDGGRQPGEFYGVHSIDTDSKGNIFTAETFGGRRVQKFVYKGVGPVTKQDQGVLWPKTAKSPI